MSRDLGRFGIRVVTIAPGLIDTPMAKDVNVNNEMAKKLIFSQIPLGRFGEAEEFAHMAKTSVENSYLNGTTLRMDGGILLPHM